VWGPRPPLAFFILHSLFVYCQKISREIPEKFPKKNFQKNPRKISRKISRKIPEHAKEFFVFS